MSQNVAQSIPHGIITKVSKNTKTEIYPVMFRFTLLLHCVNSQSTNVTDRQTDKRHARSASATFDIPL